MALWIWRGFVAAAVCMYLIWQRRCHQRLCRLMEEMCPSRELKCRTEEPCRCAAGEDAAGGKPCPAHRCAGVPACAAPCVGADADGRGTRADGADTAADAAQTASMSRAAFAPGSMDEGVENIMTYSVSKTHRIMGGDNT